MAKNQSLLARLREKDSQGEHDLNHVWTPRKTRRLVIKT